MIRISVTSKLDGIRSWSLQARDTCPGAIGADACKGCYATQGNYRYPNVKAPRIENREDWKRDEWEDEMVSQSGGEGELSKKQLTVRGSHFQSYVGSCVRCGAWRGQLGLEPTIDLYLKHLLSIFDECKRVLRDDGTMWVNLGDSYSGSGKAGSNPEYQDRHTEFGKPSVHTQRFGNPTTDCGIPAKSLCLIPYRFAIEMVDRGWILRNIIIWHKPNCMPSSVKDRFTVDFEPVFFFVKSRKYWFEQQYEQYSESYFTDSRHGSKELTHLPQKDYSGQGKIVQTPTQLHDNMFTKPIGQGRNRRCVWTIPTQPYPESHFATFPEALIEPMIRAGCPKGGTVLDPFCGSGTTMRVAEKLNRVGIGFDLAYENLQDKRMKLIQKQLW